jgi:hypothetical protein
MHLKLPLASLLLAAGIAAPMAFADNDHGNTQPDPLLIKMRDTCDAPTFNAAFGPGTCVGSFRTTLDQFLEELTQDKVVGSWRYHPFEVKAKKGTPLTIQNLGGELHTFTRVKEFGGGFVQVLNDLSGTPTPAPECATNVNGVLVPAQPSASNLFIPAGQTAPGETVERGKTVKYMCCIHPWMRITINPKGRHD